MRLFADLSVTVRLKVTKGFPEDGDAALVIGSHNVNMDVRGH